MLVTRFDGRGHGFVYLLPAFTDCLGPCSEANVVFLYLAGHHPLWLRRVNDVDAFRRILDWASEALDGGDARLPSALAARSFTWGGGGEGLAPPLGS